VILDVVLLITLPLIVLAVWRPRVALGLAAAATVGIPIALCIALDDYDASGATVWLVLVPVVLAILLTRGSPDRDEWPQKTAKWLLVPIACWMALPWLLMAFGGAVPGLVVAALLAGMVLRYLSSSMRAKAHYVVSTLAACTRQSMPLPEGIEAAVAGRTDKRAWLLRRIHVLLSQGVSLSDAVRRGYRGCPAHVVATLEVAERIGQVPQALERLEADLRADVRRASRPRPLPPWYPVLVLLVAFGLLGAVFVWVVPAYRKICAEMGFRLPPSTETVIDIWRSGGDLVGLAIFLGGVIGVPMGIYAMFRPRRPREPRALSRLGDLLKWHLPVFRWFERNQGMLRTVEALRMSLAAGLTLDRAIDSTLTLDVNGWYRRRLWRWSERVERGGDVSASARACRIGRPIAWAFDQRVNPGGAPAVLEMLEDVFRHNYSYRANLVRFIGWPGVVVLLAAVVGYVVYALYMPMIRITEAAVQYAVP